MGLFDKGAARALPLSPRLALAAGLTYITAADGIVEPVERATIFRLLPDEDALETAQHYVRRTRFADYLERATGLLTPPQRLCLLLNMVDTALADGYLAPEEQAMLAQTAAAFGIPAAQLEAYTSTLRAKNNLSLFA